MKEVGSLITVTSLLAMKNTLATLAIIVPSNNNSHVTGQVSLAFLNPVKSLVLMTNYISSLKHCQLSREIAGLCATINYKLSY